MNKNKIEEIKNLLIQSLDQSWEKTSNLNEEDRHEAFFKNMESKLSYMKEEGFIDGFTVNEKTLEDFDDIEVDE